MCVCVRPASGFWFTYSRTTSRRIARACGTGTERDGSGPDGTGGCRCAVRVRAGDLSQLRKKPLVLKEGVTYRVKITFYVQREIVAGLKYVQQSYRGPIKGASRPLVSSLLLCMCIALTLLVRSHSRHESTSSLDSFLCVWLLFHSSTQFTLVVSPSRFEFECTAESLTHSCWPISDAECTIFRTIDVFTYILLVGKCFLECFDTLRMK